MGRTFKGLASAQALKCTSPGVSRSYLKQFCSTTNLDVVMPVSTCEETKESYLLVHNRARTSMCPGSQNMYFLGGTILFFNVLRFRKIASGLTFMTDSLVELHKILGLGFCICKVGEITFRVVVSTTEGLRIRLHEEQSTRCKMGLLGVGFSCGQGSELASLESVNQSYSRPSLCRIFHSMDAHILMLQEL